MARETQGNARYRNKQLGLFFKVRGSIALDLGGMGKLFENIEKPARSISVKRHLGGLYMPRWLTMASSAGRKRDTVFELIKELGLQE